MTLTTQSIEKALALCGKTMGDMSIEEEDEFIKNLVK